jgi:hypothetical protein
MPPKESKISATTRKSLSEDTAIIDARLRIVLVRPAGPVLERLIDLAKKRPGEMFFDYLRGELTDNTSLAFLEGADGGRVPISEPVWRMLRATHPEVLVHLVRALSDAVTA